MTNGENIVMVTFVNASGPHLVELLVMLLLLDMLLLIPEYAVIITRNGWSQLSPNVVISLVISIT